MSGFPFSPEKLASLAALSQEINAAGAPPQLSMPVVIDDEGRAWLPAADGEAWGWHLHPGIRLAWAPVPESDGVILAQMGGVEPEDGFEEEGVVAFLTRAGFKRYIADLHAIDAKLGLGPMEGDLDAPGSAR